MLLTSGSARQKPVLDVSKQYFKNHMTRYEESKEGKENQTWLSTEVVKLCVFRSGMGECLGIIGHRRASASSSCKKKSRENVKDHTNRGNDEWKSQHKNSWVADCNSLTALSAYRTTQIQSTAKEIQHLGQLVSNFLRTTMLNLWNIGFIKSRVRVKSLLHHLHCILQATGMPPADYYHDRFAACGSQANCSTYHHTNSLWRAFRLYIIIYLFFSSLK